MQNTLLAGVSDWSASVVANQALLCFANGSLPEAGNGMTSALDECAMGALFMTYAEITASAPLLPDA